MLPNNISVPNLKLNFIKLAVAFAALAEKLDGFILALHSDPSIERPEKSKPYLTLKEREIMVKAIKYVWYVEPYDTEEDLLRILQETKPDVRVLGNNLQQINLGEG